jgi:XrtJ-associated TM-motif-TM protein
MKSAILRVVVLATFLGSALPLLSQDGCSDSPENPTAVLALIGVGGAFICVARSRFKVRRNASKR